jgi:hypothetical protein
VSYFRSQRGLGDDGPKPGLTESAQSLQDRRGILSWFTDLFSSSSSSSGETPPIAPPVDTLPATEPVTLPMPRPPFPPKPASSSPIAPHKVAIGVVLFGAAALIAHDVLKKGRR